MDYQTIIATVSPILTVLMWMYLKIDKKFEKIDQDFKDLKFEIGEIKAQIKEIRIDLNRIKIEFYSKDYCALKDDKSERKFE